MENMEKIFKTTTEEIERLLSSKTVVGDPITIDGKTMIPLISLGFGFGVGGGEGGTGKEEGSGVGTGGGGGVKPVAVMIIDQDGVRVEPVKSGAASAFERAVETVSKAATKSKDTEE